MPYVCVPEGVWDILFKIVLTIIRYFHPKIHTSNKRVHEPFFKAKTNHTPTPFTKRKAAKNKIKTETLCFSESFLENNLYNIYIYKSHLNFWTNKISPTSAIIIYTQPFNQRPWWLPLKNGLNYLKGSCLQVEIWELMVVGCFQLGGLVGSSWLVS